MPSKKLRKKIEIMRCYVIEGDVAPYLAVYDKS